MAKAYLLERDIARYPRIVLGSDLLAFYEAEKTKEYSGPQGVLHQLAIENMGRFIRRESDGTTSLDYLNPVFLEVHSPKIRPIVRDAWRNVRAAHERAKNEGDMKLKRRYEIVDRYFAERLGGENERSIFVDLNLID